MEWWSKLQSVEEDESVDSFKDCLEPTRLSGYSEIWMRGSFLLCVTWAGCGGTLPHFTPLLIWDGASHANSCPGKSHESWRLRKCTAVLSVFGQASNAVALMAVEPIAKQTCWPKCLCLLLLCAQIWHWSQMAVFSCVPPELKLYPQAVLCIYWSSLEWNGQYTYFKSILFGMLILF